MAQVTPQVAPPSVAELAQRARGAAHVLAALPHQRRRELLLLAAERLEQRRAEVLDANRADIAEAQPLVAAGQMTESTLARLRTSDRGVVEMAAKMREVANLPDPLGGEL